MYQYLPLFWKKTQEIWNGVKIQRT